MATVDTIEPTVAAEGAAGEGAAAAPSMETPRRHNHSNSSSSSNTATTSHRPRRRDPFLEPSRDSRFSCNICLDNVQEPVVTQCGHLYCWPCLYRWLEPGMSYEERLGLFQQSQTSSLHIISPTVANASRRVCPVCKADCAVSTLVPIYVRNHEEEDDSEDHFQHDEAKPSVSEDDELANAHGEGVEETDPTSTTGLRLRFRSRDSVIPSPVHSSPERPSSQELQVENEEPPLPSRPTPLISSPARRAVSYQQSNHQGRPTANAATNTAPMMGTGVAPTNSLSQGLAFSLQAFLSQNLVNSNMSGSGTSSTFIPPLHRPTTTRGGAANNGSNWQNTQYASSEQQHATIPAGGLWNDVPSDDSATEFLSRLLLLLGSFVVLCLLLC